MRLSPSQLAILFAIGAAGGLIGDAGHVQSGTTRYLSDAVPFVWESALWFPLGVGAATVSVGELRLRLASPRTDGGLREAAGAIAAVLGIYAVTALVHDQVEGPATVLVCALAVLVASWLADGMPAIVCGLAAAVAGPLVEIVIVATDLAEYAPQSDGLFGVPLWLPALYFAFGVVAARLAELVASSSISSGASSPE